ncbi:alpha/beta hydrolase [Cognatishimia sp. SS12]|uniref:alpha/beta fold hydrolase n=1 Tax=Cognatishimia sp. SS12 TaxID=2979465 RepID=UPI00232BA873|nr:alpha/beta hydrolase [Cognatishimia sp. SS12]MDC0737093.1 alpha/beta hydrolase [Cognatishimia sp. SS12]
MIKARANEARAEKRYPPEGQILRVDGHPVHVVVRGSGPDLVLIHGSSGSARDFTFSLVGKLADRYRVIAIDRPGLGYTAPMGGASIQQQATLLQKTAAQLGAETPIVLGQSYGGSVALAWAAHHPDNIAALVALSTPSLPWTSALSLFYGLTSHPLLGPLVIPVLTAWVPTSKVNREVESVFAPQSAPEGYAAHFGPGLTLRRSALRANALQRAGLLEEIKALQPRLPQITTPTELLHGDADTTVGLEIHSRPLSRILPNAHLTVLEGIGHMPHHSAETAVIDAIDRASARAKLN